jgi:hypothetical protein
MHTRHSWPSSNQQHLNQRKINQRRRRRKQQNNQPCIPQHNHIPPNSNRDNPSWRYIQLRWTVPATSKTVNTPFRHSLQATATIKPLQQTRAAEATDQTCLFYQNTNCGTITAIIRLLCNSATVQGLKKPKSSNLPTFFVNPLTNVNIIKNFWLKNKGLTKPTVCTWPLLNMYL